LLITIPITNTGAVEGAESVQAYIHDPQSRLPRPEKELKAFDKLFLASGETGEASLELDRNSVGYYDTDLNAWIAEEGGFEVWIGASSQDIRYVYFVSPVTDWMCKGISTNEIYRQRISFEVKESFTWIF
jgi:beta-glucosidase